MTDQPTTPAQVAVKPLVWEQVSDRCVDAEGMGKLYRVIARQDGTARLRHSHYDRQGTGYPTLEAAKAAAQADYEARIRSALIPAHPAPVPAVPDDVADLIADIRTEQAVGDIRSAFADHIVSTIEAQAAENVRLENRAERESDERHRAFGEVRRANARVEKAEAETVRLEQQISRLTEALTDFVAMGEQYSWDDALTGRQIVMRNARAALAQPADDSHGEEG